MLYHKNLNMKHLLIFALPFLVNCSNGGGGGSKNPAGGNNNSYTVTQQLTITGPDSSDYGTTLEIGTIFAKAATENMHPDYVVLYDPNTTVIDEEGATQTSDPNNGIAIVVNSFKDHPYMTTSISMGIKVNNKDYQYICQNPPMTFQDCGDGIKLDLTNRTLSLDHVEVQDPNDGSLVMTLDGDISW